MVAFRVWSTKINLKQLEPGNSHSIDGLHLPLGNALGCSKDNFILQKYVLDRKTRILVNSGATHTIMNPAPAPARTVMPLQQSVRLTTATAQNCCRHYLWHHPRSRLPTPRHHLVGFRYPLVGSWSPKMYHSLYVHKTWLIYALIVRMVITWWQ